MAGDVLGAIGKVAATGGVAAAVLTPVWLGTWGPHGQFQPRPHCPAAQTCIVVAGLDNDVYWMPFAGGSGFVDLRDGDTSRVVVWTRRIAHEADANAQVLKYPREIAMPNPGAPDEVKQRAAANRQIADIMRSTGADLVLVGAVEEGGVRYQLVLLRPSAGLPDDPASYAASQTGAPPDFARAVTAAMREATKLEPAPAAALPPPPRPPAPPPVSQPVLPPPVAPKAQEPAPTAAYRPSPPVYVPAPPPVRTPADIFVSAAAKTDMQRLYVRTIGARTEPGYVVVTCSVSTNGRLYGCYASQTPRGADAFARALVRYVQENMRSAPARLNGLAQEGGVATVRVETRQE